VTGVIICAYAGMTRPRPLGFKPTLVYLDDQNRVTHTGDAIAAQAA